MLSWNDHSNEVCRKISERTAVLKVVLKTKDDPFFLRRWVDYHANIVGLENIIIFDNDSTNAEVQDVYASISDKSAVFRFSGYQDDVHRVNKFPELYETLRASSSFYMFLDTDEFLVWINEDLTYIHDSRIVDKVASLRNVSVIPGIWLENALGFKDRFLMNLEIGHLQIGIRSGKPMFSKHANVIGMLNHNFQVSQEIFSPTIITNLAVLHRKWESPKQRIAANMLKLRSYRWLGPDDTIERVTSTDPEQLPPGNTKNFIREIQKLLALDEVALDGVNLNRHHIRLRDGKIEFGHDAQRAALGEFIMKPQNHRSDIKPGT